MLHTQALHSIILTEENWLYNTEVMCSSPFETHPNGVSDLRTYYKVCNLIIINRTNRKMKAN
jgi:hypothetical protein